MLIWLVLCPFCNSILKFLFITCASRTFTFYLTYCGLLNRLKMWTQSACHSAYDRTALDIALRKKEVILRALSCKEMDFAEAYSDYYASRRNGHGSLLINDRKGLIKYITWYLFNLWWDIIGQPTDLRSSLTNLALSLT